jgi:hypothetical protein
LTLHSNNKCWICGGGSTRSLSVDHNHTTGHIRGLLCMPCNRTLGVWRDNPTVADRAADYLRQDGAAVYAILGRQPKGSRRSADSS